MFTEPGFAPEAGRCIAPLAARAAWHETEDTALGGGGGGAAAAEEENADHQEDDDDDVDLLEESAARSPCRDSLLASMRPWSILLCLESSPSGSTATIAPCLVREDGQLCVDRLPLLVDSSPLCVSSFLM